MTPPIAIIGAGPSGLTLARLLELAGIDYMVFESEDIASPNISYSGSLDIHPTDGQLAIQEAGLMDEFKVFARYDASTKLADTQGKVFMDFVSKEGGTDRPEIDRKDLRSMLLKAIPAEKIRWASRVHHVQKNADDKMTVHFVNGSSESSFRLVVGADGGWSKVKSLLNSPKPEYTGLCYLTSTITPTNPIYNTAVSLAGKGNYNAIGHGKAVVVMKLSDGAYWIAIGMRLPETWNTDNDPMADPPALRQWLLKDHFSDWTKVHRDIIEHCEGKFRFWPLYISPMDSLEYKTVPGVTVIGDAAHICPPSGDGANVALFDARELARQIKAHGLESLYAAVEQYEKEMFPRAKELVQQSIATNEQVFAEDAPKGFMEMINKMMAAGEGK